MDCTAGGGWGVSGRQPPHSRSMLPAEPCTARGPRFNPPTPQGVSFGVFGLGNRQYEHFCAMGKKVSVAMRALGAAEVLPRGEGDDDRRVTALCCACLLLAARCLLLVLLVLPCSVPELATAATLLSTPATTPPIRPPPLQGH